MGAIRHRDVEPDARCNGVIWFYNEDPTPPGGEAYMGWFSNPVISKAIRTFGGDPPPKPRPIESAILHLQAEEELLLQSWDVTEAVRQLVKDHSCHSIAGEQPLHAVLVERGALTVSIFKAAAPEPESAAAEAAEPEPVDLKAAEETKKVASAEDEVLQKDIAAALIQMNATMGTEMVQDINQSIQRMPLKEQLEALSNVSPIPLEPAAALAEAAAAEEGVPPEDSAVVAAEPELEPEPESAPAPDTPPEPAAAAPEPEPPAPAPAPEPVAAPQPVTSRLTVTVDGQCHEIPCSLSAGGAPVNVRQAMKC